MTDTAVMAIQGVEAHATSAWLEALLRTACEIHPDHRISRERLVRYLFNADRLEELVEQFEALSSGLDPACLHYIGLAALTLGDNETAETALSEAARSGHSESRGALAAAVYRQGRDAEALAIARDALDEVPGDDFAFEIVFGALLSQNRHAEAWDLCICLAGSGPISTRAVSALAWAATTEQQVAMVRRATHPDYWIERSQLPISKGLLDIVTRGLRSLDCWSPLPRTKATIGSGRRIEKLHLLKAGAGLNDLFTKIEAAAAAYAEMRRDGYEALAADGLIDPQVSSRFEIASWAISVNGDGHEGWHAHPDGWLSGVYYLDVPDLSQSKAEHAGQVEFGPYPLGIAAQTNAWPGTRITPQAGDLLLFPSYLAHRTWPTLLPADRLCIAFDILKNGKAESAIGEPVGVPAVAQDEVVMQDSRAVTAPGGNDAWLAMNIESGRFLALDAIAHRVWQLMTDPVSISDIVDALVDEYDGDEMLISTDVTNILAQLMAAELCCFRTSQRAPAG